MPPPYPGISAYNGYAAASAPPPGAVGFAQPPAQSAAGKSTRSVALESCNVN